MTKPLGMISTYAKGVHVIFEWRIPGFLYLPEEDGTQYSSPDFSFRGHTWYLVIRHDKKSFFSGIDLRLWKHSSDHSIKQPFSLLLKTVTGDQKPLKLEEGFKIETDIKRERDFHEFCFSIQRSELFYNKYLLPEGVLTIICEMKNATSVGSATGNDSVHAYVGASTQHVGVSTEHVGASTERVGASTQIVEKKYKATTSGSSTRSQERKALHDFKELFLKKEDCDVTIKVRGLVFPVHRVILKARSPVLASTFRHDMKESATGVLEIDDCDASSFSDFLCFLYCADMQMITQKNVFDLFTLADKYQVLDLRSKCLEFMKNNLNVDTFCETTTLALQHSETDMIKLSTDYFTKNAPKIIVTVKWQTFLAENPTESNELFIKLLVPNSS